MNADRLKLALGPLDAGTPRAAIDAFYAEVADAPVDIVHLSADGGGVYRIREWLATAEMLARTGKEVVIDAQILLADTADVRTLRRIARERTYLVLANDMGSVQMLADHAPFAAGPQLDIYNAATLAFVLRAGAVRWTPPAEMSFASLHAILGKSDRRPDVEVFANGPSRLCGVVDSLPALRALHVTAVRVDPPSTAPEPALRACRAALDGTLPPPGHRNRTDLIRKMTMSA